MPVSLFLAVSLVPFCQYWGAAIQNLRNEYQDVPGVDDWFQTRMHRGDSLYTDLMLISGGNACYRAYHSTDGWLFAALRDSIARVEINSVHLHVTEFQERGHAHTHILEGRACFIDEVHDAFDRIEQETKPPFLIRPSRG